MFECLCQFVAVDYRVNLRILDCNACCLDSEKCCIQFQNIHWTVNSVMLSFKEVDTEYTPIQNLTLVVWTVNAKYVNVM